MILDCDIEQCLPSHVRNFCHDLRSSSLKCSLINRQRTTSESQRRFSSVKSTMYTPSVMHDANSHREYTCGNGRKVCISTGRQQPHNRPSRYCLYSMFAVKPSRDQVVNLHMHAHSPIRALVMCHLFTTDQPVTTLEHHAHLMFCLFCSRFVCLPSCYCYFVSRFSDVIKVVIWGMSHSNRGLTRGERVAQNYITHYWASHGKDLSDSEPPSTTSDQRIWNSNL